jgi:4-hydroxy-3-methylbut-2-enyl diphosphate reductase
VDDLDPDWFAGKSSFGITAGASAPEILVQQVVERLQQMTGQGPVEVPGVEENIVFRMPRELVR